MYELDSQEEIGLQSRLLLGSPDHWGQVHLSRHLVPFVLTGLPFVPLGEQVQIGPVSTKSRKWPNRGEMQ